MDKNKNGVCSLIEEGGLLWEVLLPYELKCLSIGWSVCRLASMLACLNFLKGLGSTLLCTCNDSGATKERGRWVKGVEWKEELMVEESVGGGAAEWKEGWRRTA